MRGRLEFSGRFVILVREIVASTVKAPVATAGPSATVTEAATKMKENNVGAVAVLDSCELQGMFSERDAGRGNPQ